MNRSALNATPSNKSLRFASTIIDESTIHTDDLESTYHNGSAQDSPDIPDITERLAYLKPSRQLLEFYRKRFAQQDTEHNALVEQLNGYKQIYDEQFDTEWGMRQREEEINELQKALSDMQLSLFQEREHVLRLYAENDRYKIRDLSSRRAIKKLLELNGKGIDDKNNDPLSSSIEDRLHKRRPATLHKIPKSDGYSLVINAPHPEEESKAACESLSKQIEMLQNQLEKQTRDFKEQIEAKMQERNQLADQYNYIREKDMDKVKTVSEKLHKTQDLLYMSTNDLLTIHQEAKAQERQWMIQKDKLLRELDSVKEQLNIDQPEHTRKVVLNVSNNAGDTTARQKRELEKLREDVANAHRLQEMYREQVISLEDDLARLREQDDLKNDDFNEKVDKMGKRYQIMKNRFEDLEKRRNLEVEGFKNDIKTLRKRLKDMQQQLYKVTLGRTDSYLDESRPDDLDLAVLHNIRKTASRSTKLKEGLTNMKLRIHKMETQNCK